MDQVAKQVLDDELRVSLHGNFSHNKFSQYTLNDRLVDILSARYARITKLC